MKFSKIYLLLLVTAVITSCGSKKSEINFSLNSDKKVYHLGESIKLLPKSLSGEKIESISYTFQNKEISSVNEIVLKNHLLGEHTIKATIKSDGVVENVFTKITVLNDKAPKVYSYNILNTYPHNEDHYTQGLEFVNDNLYESAGRNGESKLLLKDLKTGDTKKEHNLADTFFAEGLTIVGTKIHQLTWKGNVGFTYDLNTFEEQGTFAYNQSKEGWGLCHSDKYIYKSDGSTKIWKLNKDTLAEEGYIQIATNKALKSRFNELEWVNGKIYANTWQKDGIAIINPDNGAIEGIINLKGIREKVGVAADDINKVLNGIAYKEESKQLFITGKYWNSLFEIEIIN